MTQRERNLIIYIWVAAFAAQIVFHTYKHFFFEQSLVTSPPVNALIQNISSKNTFAIPEKFKLESDSTPAPSQITQRAKVRFPKIGLLEVRAVEEIGALPRIEFINPKSKKLIGKVNIGSFDENRKLYALCDTSYPCASFKVLRIEGFPKLLIFGVGIYHGGSDSSYITSVIGEVNGQFKELTTEQMSVSNQGGIFVGNLGKRRGIGAASWNFIWDDSEAHYDYHRYEAEIYRFDNKTNLFKKTRIIQTRRKYDGRGEGALRELKLPIKDMIQTVPKLEYIGQYKETGF